MISEVRDKTQSACFDTHHESLWPPDAQPAYPSQEEKVALARMATGDHTDPLLRS